MACRERAYTLKQGPMACREGEYTSASLDCSCSTCASWLRHSSAPGCVGPFLLHIASCATRYSASASESKQSPRETLRLVEYTLPPSEKVTAALTARTSL
eukprot:1315627-Pyramimonas_sp.AAC.1